MGDLLCAIHQPNFFPRLSTLAKLFAADIWVILDNVQFARRDYQHRCYLAAVPDVGLPGRWLTVPVHLPAGRATLIRDVRLAEPGLALRRVTSPLRQYYRRSPHRAAILDLLLQIEDAFACTERLADCSERATLALLRAVKWTGVICHSSDLPARTGRSQRLADLTRAAGGTAYLCGTGGSRYLDPEPFISEGLEIKLFTPPEHTASGTWKDDRRVTALADLAAAGPTALAEQLSEHACAWRSSRGCLSTSQKVIHTGPVARPT
jgi:hypothetical protein